MCYPHMCIVSGVVLVLSDVSCVPLCPLFWWFYVSTSFCLVIEKMMLFVSLSFTPIFVVSSIWNYYHMCYLCIFVVSMVVVWNYFVCLTLPLVTWSSMHTLGIYLNDFFSNEFLFIFYLIHIEIKCFFY